MANGHGAPLFSGLASPAMVLPALSIAALAMTLALRWIGLAWADRAGLAALALIGAPVVWRTLAGMARGRFATDIVATMAILGSLILAQPVAGLVIVLMQTGGELLERYAEGRASHAVRALEEDAPRRAHRMVSGRIDDVAAEAVNVGDHLLVRPGEMIPCDGVVTAGTTHLDVARLTGEPSPERVAEASWVRSGALNLESPIQIRATARAADSLYARIVDLVRTAQADKSPIQRLADRYALWFTPATIFVCLAVWWWSHDPIRVLAVLVVATPCPLILATPVAIIGGINRAARHQIVIRTGAALEQIGQVDVAIFDKTGTLTIGFPEVAAVRSIGATPSQELLSLAASVEQHSGHLLARTVVHEAEQRGAPILTAADVVEAPGQGVTGVVEGRRISIGSSAYVSAHQPTAAAVVQAARAGGGGLRAFVAIDGEAAGVIEFADRTRAGVPDFLASLRALGIARTLLVSGDHEPDVRALAHSLGIAEARGDLLPDQKVAVVRELQAAGHRVLMTGDGTNDAPALSAATVGIALAAHGGGISAEAADIVLLADDVTKVADAIRIGRRATRIARQSIAVGLGLSGAAMVVAALGHITPTSGALLQEAIDVAVILNALRAARS